MKKAKRITSEDVARRAGVSRTTVSLVLNNVHTVQISEETRRRVFETAKSLGYVPDAAAQALASRRVRVIGLVLTRSPHLVASDSFLTQVLDGLIGIVHQHGMRLLIDILELHNDKDVYLDLVRGKRIDGIILSGPRYNDEILKLLEEQPFPTVLMGQLPEAGCCSVDVDNFKAAYQAISYLIRLGHTHIACITNADPRYTAAAERLGGYRRALEDAGLAYDESYVRYGDFDPDSGYRQMRSLLVGNSQASSPRITAAFVASDVVAFGAKAAIRELGLRVPEDISLIGFDDVPFARYMDPPLTTIRLPAYDLGWAAGDTLISLIRGETLETSQILLETELIERKSCAAPKSA